MRYLLSDEMEKMLCEIDDRYRIEVTEVVSKRMEEIEGFCERDGEYRRLLEEYGERKGRLSLTSEEVLEIGGKMNVKNMEDEITKRRLKDIRVMIEGLEACLTKRICGRNECVKMLETGENERSGECWKRCERRFIEGVSEKCRDVDEMRSQFAEGSKVELNSALGRFFERDVSGLRKGDMYCSDGDRVVLVIGNKVAGGRKEQMERQFRKRKHGEGVEFSGETSLHEASVYFKDTGLHLKTSGTSFSEETRVTMWKHWMGEEETSGACPVCNVEVISVSNFVAGHIESKNCGGEGDAVNGMPICGKCNSRMGDQSLWGFVRMHHPANTTLIEKGKRWILQKHGIEIPSNEMDIDCASKVGDCGNAGVDFQYLLGDTDLHRGINRVCTYLQKLVS
jgi:hypothetical protein